jgi:hypothetical protein
MVPGCPQRERVGGAAENGHSDVEGLIRGSGTTAAMRVASNLALFAALLLALPSSAAAQSSQPAAKSDGKSETTLHPPALFYLAKGDPHACGQDCSEWIAAEGYLDPAAAQRLRTLVRQLAGRKLPIFFHSPGGIQTSALAIGRLMREQQMTAGVGKTIPAGCAAIAEQACRDLKLSGQLTAQLSAVGAFCNSACVYALIGAQVRQVPPGARLGVHTGKLLLMSPDGLPKVPSMMSQAQLAGYEEALRRYLREMGVDTGLLDLAVTIPHDQVHYLSRDQIAGFGIDARNFQETRWTEVEAARKRLVVAKFFAQARGPNGKEFRTSVIYLSCAMPSGVGIIYSRGLASDEAGAARPVRLTIGKRTIAFRPNVSVKRIDAFDTGGSFQTRIAYAPFEYFETGAAAGSIDITETKPKDASSRVIKLSTQGLSASIKTLRQRCARAA